MPPPSAGNTVSEMRQIFVSRFALPWILFRELYTLPSAWNTVSKLRQIFASLPTLPCFLFIYMKGAVRHFRMRTVKAQFLSVPHPGIIF